MPASMGFENEKLRQLIKLMEKNDGRAFEEFFNLLYPRFYRYAFLYVKSDILCEELVSDVFLKLWNIRYKLNDIQQLEFYLFRAVKNQALTYLKRKTNEPVEITEYIQSHLIDYREPENLLIAAELADKVEEGIASLPDKCQIIFRMVRQDGLSYKQVAVLLDISPKTIENQMNTALKKLRIVIEKYYSETKSGDFTKSVLFNFIY